MGLFSCCRGSGVTELTPEPHEEKERNLENFTPVGEFKIFCWKFLGIGKVGHISLRLSDGTYISHWPENSLKAIGMKPASQMTYDDDIRLEKRYPEKVGRFLSAYLYEKRIKLWWDKFVEDKEAYNLATQNCAHVVSEAIRVGIMQSYHENEITLNTGLFQMPMNTLDEINSLFSEWPHVDYMNFYCSRYIYNFGRRLYASTKDISSFRADINRIIDNESLIVNIDVFDVLKKNIESLLDDIQKTTQKLSTYLRGIYIDLKSAPANPMVALNKKAIEKSTHFKIFENIENARSIYESDYANAISRINRICGDIIYLHEIIERDYSDNVKNLFEKGPYLYLLEHKDD